MKALYVGFRVYLAWMVRCAFCLGLVPAAGLAQSSYYFTAVAVKSQTGVSPTVRIDDKTAVVVDAAGNMYWGQNGLTGGIVHKVTPSAGTDTILAGGIASGPSRDGKGTDATFTDIRSVAIDCNGNLYAIDWDASAPVERVRKIAPDGTVTTLALSNPSKPSKSITVLGCPPRSILVLDGEGSVLDLPLDGSGETTVASGLNDPQSLVWASELNRFIVAETGNNAILSIGLDGSRSTLASVPDPTTVAWSSPLLLFSANGTLRGLNVFPGTGGGAPFTAPANVTVHYPLGKQPELRVDAVSAASGAATALFAALATDPDPFYGLFLFLPFQVTNAPSSQTVAAGYPATFRANIATNLGATTHCQWLWNGAPIPGETNSTYALSSVQPTNGGIYTVAVGLNPANTNLPDVVSPGAALNVTAPFVWSTLLARQGGFGVAPSISSPAGLAVKSNIFYIADTGNNRIRALAFDGVDWTTNTLAGGGVGGTSPGYVDGAGSAALFGSPSGIAVDDSTNIFIADTGNNLVRLLQPGNPEWIVSTIAGATAGGFSDGVGTNALFKHPTSLALDTRGSLYVADAGNNTIRKLTPAGGSWGVTTLAGQPGVTGSSDGTGTNATFSAPQAVAVDRSGNVLVADFNNSVIRQITAVGVVSTIAGLAKKPGSTDGLGSAARFSLPAGIAVDCSGDIFVADYSYCLIRKLTPFGTNWMVITVGGSPGVSGFQDGIGNAAWFWNPSGLAADCSGNIYVADTLNNRIRSGYPVTADPAIVSNSPTQTVAAGGQTRISATVSNSSPVTYQWLFNGAALPGQTDTSLSLTGLVRTKGGIYQLEVVGTNGAVVSDGISLRVLVPPVLQRLEPLQANSGFRVFFADADGGLPDDLSKLVLQWRSTLPQGTDTNWESHVLNAYLTNGLVGLDDTNASVAARFYRVLEY